MSACPERLDDDPVAYLDLCHRGNYENIIGQPDSYPMPTPDDLPDRVWFTCASEANGINMFPCTGSKHVGSLRVECTCPCHKVATR